MRKSSGIDETGDLVWQLLLALFVAWIIITLMVIKGIKVSGKIVYVTALFPYVVLLILGIRGWMLDGADIGIKYYIYPDFSKLNKLSVWSDAACNLKFSSFNIFFFFLYSIMNLFDFDFPNSSNIFHTQRVLWRPHRARLVQSFQHEHSERCHHGLAGQLWHLYIRRLRCLLLHRLFGQVDRPRSGRSSSGGPRPRIRRLSVCDDHN